MNLVLKFRDKLVNISRPLVLELEQLVTIIRTTFRQEHNDDGTHAPRRAVTLTNAAGTTYYLWVDATGDLRVGTVSPTVNDLGGTVVGGQS